MIRRLSILAALLALCATARGGHLWLSVMDDATSPEALYRSMGATALWLPVHAASGVDVVGGVAATNAVQPTLTAEGWTFSGTNQYLDMGYPASCEVGTNSLTMCAWVSLASTTSVAGIIGKGGAGDHDRWHLNANSSIGKFAGFVHEGATTGDAITTSYTNLTTIGTRYHVALVVDRSTGGYASTLYVNGVSTGTSATNARTGAITYDGNVTAPFRIGVYNNVGSTPTYFLNGTVSLAAVFKGAALTPAQIEQLADPALMGY